MRVALVYLNALQGGDYSRDVRWLAAALAAKGIDVKLIATEGSNTEGLGGVEVVPPGDIARLADGETLFHVWGLFHPPQLRASWRLRNSDLVILSSLAHLMRAHVRHKWWKKVPYLTMLRQLLLNKPLSMHVFSRAEHEELPKYLRQRPFFTANVGVFPAPHPAPTESGDYFVFFGRNDVYQKGLDVLLSAFELAVRDGLDRPLVIAGQPQGSSEEMLRSAATRPALKGLLEVVGRTSDEEKWALLSRARVLMFLSRWDGPPRPIREALAVGTPAIVSPGTNMGDVIASRGAGCCVSPEPSEVSRAMLQAQDEQIVAAWRSGAKKLSEDLSWERVADRYIEGYSLIRQRTT